MILEITVEEAIREIGHDGSEIWWPGLPEPHPRRSFSTQEFVDVCYRRGYALIQIDGCPVLVPNFEDQEPKIIFPDYETRLMGYMAGNKGLILGRYSSLHWHMVAWDGESVFDPGPSGRIYKFNDPNVDAITIDTFYLLRNLG